MYSRSLSVVHRLSLQCGFINGDNTGTPYTRQFTDLYIQPGKKISYTFVVMKWMRGNEKLPVVGNQSQAWAACALTTDL